jgi:hypothetical protein
MRTTLVLLLLAGCATTERVWVRPGASSQDFHMDSGQCRAHAFSGYAHSLAQRVVVFESCLQGKGWYTEERPR